MSKWRRRVETFSCSPESIRRIARRYGTTDESDAAVIRLAATMLELG